MGKVAQNQVKYVVEAELSSSGLVEKPDIVGAIFGQTEGLLGEDLDLRELQERGRVGRIDVQVEEKDSGSEADIKIPTSLDATETALIGAALETIERVGPTSANISVNRIRDERTSKRDYIVKRAKQLLEDIEDEKPEKNDIADEVKKEVRTREITEYRGFSAGPEAEEAGEIVLVEGRADVVNLLSHGVKNTLAIGGTDVPEDINQITEEKIVTAFLDGDRGGDLILKELKNETDLDNVCKAPEKKEVEELGKEQVYEALRDKKPVKYEEEKDVEPERLEPDQMEEIEKQMNDLIGTRAVYVVNSDMVVERRFPVESFSYEIEKVDNEFAVLMDGKIDNQKIEKTEETGCRCIVGMEISGNASSSELKIMTKDELEKTKLKAD